MGTELAKAYVQIIPSAEGIKGKLRELLGDESEDAGENAGKKAGNSFVAKIIAIVTAAKIGQTIMKGISASVREGADLEQSIGGIETLFKDSANRVMLNAQNAYKTAGLSANAYMESVTGFSASLLQGLGGDTEKAAKIADMALTDMSDNANKMGTDMESIQVAYQGFAKQNYTMLDNLKLGYGGTKEEMQRLLTDAEKISHIKYDMNNLADVYSAIHVIQGELDITGTTAKEAATTISGSFASMKASASNVLGYLAIGEDIKPYLGDLVDTASTFLFGNLLPAVGNVIAGIPTIIKSVVNRAVPTFMENGRNMLMGLASGLSANLPILVEGGKRLLNGLASGMAQKIPELLGMALPMLQNFSQVLHDNSGTIIDSGLKLLVGLVQGIANGIPQLVKYIPTIVSNIANIINDNMPKILATGVKMIGILAKGLIQAIPTIVENLPKIINAIINVFTAFHWMNLGKGIITTLGNGIQSMFGSIGSTSKNLLENIIKTFKNFDFGKIGKNIIEGIIKGLKNAASLLREYMTSLASSALSSVKEALGIHSPSRVFEQEVGQMIDLGIAKGIEKYAKTVTNEMKQLSGDLVGSADVSMIGSANIETSGNMQETSYNMLKEAFMDALAASDMQVVINNRVAGRLVRSWM